jgi:hypothetical protein
VWLAVGWGGYACPMTENQPAGQPQADNPKIPSPGTSEDFPPYPEGSKDTGPGGVPVPEPIDHPDPA